MYAAHLSNRGVVSVGGPDARAFLDRLLTNHVARVTPCEPCHAALLTPQGKILVEMIVSEVPAEEGGGFLLDCLRPYANDLVTKLGFYKLRAKVTVADLAGQASVVALWGEGAPGKASVAVPDPRLPGLGFRAIVDAGEVEDFARDIGATPVDEREWRRHRIGLGVPEAGEDYVLGETFPHEADMDQLGGIDFDKGCYVGQEVVSRMEHRSTARSRVVPVIAADGGFLAEGGLPVTAGDRTVGMMGSSVEGRGLALVRLDRVADALAAGQKVMAGGVEMKLVRPGWARFAFPGEATA